MSVKMACWNVRGLNKYSHQQGVASLINDNQLSFLALLETKVKIHNAMSISTKIKNNWNWLHNYDNHYNGRVWIGWDPNCWNVHRVDSSSQFITCDVSHIASSITFVATFVYAFNDGYDRMPLWSYLVRQNFSKPWCIIGDFNCVLSSHDILGGRERWTPEMQCFKDCVANAHLGQVASCGEHFTWSNLRPNSLVLKKLDRMLGNDEWFQNFGEGIVLVKHRGEFDHNPLIFQMPINVKRYSKPFQVFNYMFQLPSFLEVVEEAWNAPSRGSPMAVLSAKIKATRKALASLNKSKGDLHANVSMARNELHSIQHLLGANPRDQALLLREAQAITHLTSTLREEELLLRQKSRIRWMQSGDGNNKFFFNQAKANWNHNKILAIKNEYGTLVTGQEEVALVAVKHFQSFLGDSKPRPLGALEDYGLSRLPYNQGLLLEAPVSHEVILNTIKAMNKGKAPGPDGFNAEFYLHTWHITGPAFCAAIDSFFAGAPMHKGINSAFIALIPKTTSPSTMKDFRPISLCTFVYKCIAKILASRLQSVLHTLIDKAQSAFIPSRSISDNILLAQELIRGYGRETGTPKCALKVDLNKAFDSIRWDFLMQVLTIMGFPAKFTGWIYACIAHPFYSIKLNGVIHGYFQGSQGLRQGDPLSPYLFTIAMNYLSTMLNHMPAGFKYHWRCKDLRLTHLLFADDAIFFSHGSVASISHIMSCVDKFAGISGLSPNLQKSQCFFSCCDPLVVDWFDSTYHIPHGSLPLKFLGVPLISTKLCINDCASLIERITSRVFSWTTKTLSFAGRVRLVQTVLFSIQAYWSRHFLLPKLIHKELQRIFTRFLWKGDANSKGGAKVAWNSLCCPKEEGGLGLKNTLEWNTSLILHHLWQVVIKAPSLWATWVNNTILKHDCFWVCKIPTDCSWIWRKILRLRYLAKPHINFIIGDGSTISLWFDPWWNHDTIATTKKSVIFSQAGLPHSALVHHLIHRGSWALPTPNARHHHIDSRFRDWLHNFTPHSFDLHKPDKILWGDVAASKVKASHIWHSIRHQRPQMSWHKAVWHRLQIQRYAHTMWLACHDRLYTKVRLIRFGALVTPDCILCVGGIEDRSHIFLTCPYSAYVLSMLFRGIHWLPSANNWDAFIAELLGINDRPQRDLARLFFQTAIYHLWRERNIRLHNGGTFEPSKLLKGILLDAIARLHDTRFWDKYRHKRPELFRWNSIM